MASDWRTARVFISSTFRDMHSERDYLVKVVFPALRERLEPHRIHLVDIDLRWGITESQTENDEVLDLCLNQIDECRPFFVGLMGERYGWVPEELPDPDTKYGWTQKYTGKSVTELEIRWGVLLQEAMRDHAFFYFRDPAFLKDIPAAKRTEMAAESEEAAEKLSALKEEIRSAGLPNSVFENYPCQYAGLRINWGLARFDLDESDEKALETVAADGLVDNSEYDEIDDHLRQIVNTYGTVHLVGLEEFGNRVLEQLWNAMRKEFQLEENVSTQSETDPLELEQGFHERFIESRVRVYIGRYSLQRELLEFVNSDGENPALITGPSGSGKSAALAKFVSHYNSQKSGSLIIPHFIGASPSSTGLRQTLYRFCSILKSEFQFEDDVPPDTNSLITTFRQFVSLVPGNRKVIFVIDALNQFDEAENAHQLYWLPWQFPPHVKVILSCIDDPGREEEILKAFEHRQVERIEVPLLTDEERFEIVKEVPSLSAKSLDPKQIQLLLENPATKNPLFLLIALEELRGFGSYEQLEKRIRLFPSGEDAVTELFVQVIHRLQDEFDSGEVYDVLSLLASARRGLSDRELLDLLEGTDVPISSSKSDLFPILRQLRPYLQHRGGLRDFFHRNLYKAVKDQFLPDEAAISSAHQQLAFYFESQDYFTESLEEQRARAKRLPPTPRPVNIRKVDELPWQLLQVAKLSGKDDPKSPHWDKVADLFTDIHFLEAKAEAQPEGAA